MSVTITLYQRRNVATHDSTEQFLFRAKFREKKGHRHRRWIGEFTWTNNFFLLYDFINPISRVAHVRLIYERKVVRA